MIRSILCRNDYESYDFIIEILTANWNFYDEQDKSHLILSHIPILPLYLGSFSFEREKNNLQVVSIPRFSASFFFFAILTYKEKLGGKNVFSAKLMHKSIGLKWTMQRHLGKKVETITHSVSDKIKFRNFRFRRLN